MLCQLLPAIDFNRHIISQCPQLSHYIEANSRDGCERQQPHMLSYSILLSARNEMPYDLTCSHYQYYYYYYYYYYRICHFSALAGKYSPTLGCSNQQDQARWSYLQFKKFLTIEHVPRITDFCSCIYVFWCRLSLVRLLIVTFELIPQILLSGSLALPMASTWHIFHSPVLGTFLNFTLLLLLLITSRSWWPRCLGVGLRPLACWDCGFESCRGHGCLSVVSVVCCHVGFCATG